MTGAADAVGVFDAAVAETSTWVSPFGYPGVSEFVAHRDAHIRQALARLDEPDLDNDEPGAPTDPNVDPDDPDDEEFCPRCVAGVDSDEHHEKCVLTGHATDGEAAPAPGLHDKCHEHADVIADQRNAAMRHNGQPPTDEDHTSDGRCLDPFQCATGLGGRTPTEADPEVETLRRQRDEARLDRDDLLTERALLRAACIEIAGAAAALADNSVEGNARAALRAMETARATLADITDLAERLDSYDCTEHPIPMGVDSPDDYEKGINVSGLEIKAVLGKRR